MRRSAWFPLAIAAAYAVTAQVQIRPLPEAGYDQRIRDHVKQVRVVDTHEHLLNPAHFKEGMLDFTLLLRHYAAGDHASAGMPGELHDQFLGDTLTVAEKWRLFKPYWERSSNTAYNRAALLAADQLFGIRDLNETAVEELSARIRKAYRTDWYDRVLREKCGLEFVVEDYPFDDWENRFFGDQKMFRYVRKFDSFVLLNSKEQVGHLEKWKETGIRTLDDLVSALENAFQEARKAGIVAAKSILAYNRTLHYENATKEEAERAFQRILDAPDDAVLAFAQVKPLQDYMMHRVLDLARSNGLPVQLHTGLNTAYIGNANPTHLVNLFLEYPDVEFILFHGGYPYGGELAALAKNFRNVSIDLCWLYIISPSYSERYLHEWLETVPASKLMAFGGDFLYVENVYSHLLFAKQVVANVLIAKVRDGYLSEKEALAIAQMLFHDNAVRLLKLKKIPDSVTTIGVESPHSASRCRCDGDSVELGVGGARSRVGVGERCATVGVDPDPVR